MAPRLFVCLLCVVLAVGASSVAVANPCQGEIENLIGGSQQGDASWSNAASVMAGAVALAEPALPAIGRWNEGSGIDAAVDPSLQFLAERGLLPNGWSTATSPHEALVAAANRLVQGLGGPQLPTIYATRPSDLALRALIETTLAHVRTLVRPAAVLVWDEDENLALRALAWNWSSFPRLILFRPDVGGRKLIPRAEAIASMENCVREVDHWFSVDESTARRLLSDELDARLIVVGTEPDRPELTPWWVPSGEELDVLAYEHPAIRELDAFSVVFTGTPLPFTAWLRLLPNVRTNASPIELRRYLQSPPAVLDR